MRKRLTIFILLVVIGTLVVVFTRSTIQDDSVAVEEENPYSEIFTLPFSDNDGNMVTLSDSSFSDKALVVNSWATWCPFCKQELPDFVTLQKEFPEIVVITIDREESVDETKGYTDSLDITDDLVYLLDQDDLFYTAIGGFSMPETLFITKEREVHFHKRGFMDLEEMRRRVNELVGAIQ